MKNFTSKIQSTFLLGLVFFGLISTAQVSKTDVFNSREMIFYGLDFTKAKFIGNVDQGFDINPVSEFELVNKYIPSWNKLVAMEPDRYDLKNAFWKNNIYYDYKPVETKNAEINPHGIMDFNTHTISSVQIEAMVSSYPEGEKKEGLGLVFIVESFDKPNQNGTYYVTFFDVRSKKILFCEKVSAAPAGIGLRNYWAGSLKRVLAEIKEFRWRQWRNKVLG